MANFNDGQIQQIVDLQQFFGVSGGIVNIITHAAINMWAKNKPVRRNKFSALTAADRLAAHYGLDIPGRLGDRPNNLLTLYDGELNGWQYLRPRGSAYEEGYRHLDFIGYDHNAQRPLTNFTATDSVVYDSQTTSPFSAAAFIGLTDITAKSIEFTDIAEMLGATNNLYFGVALIKGTGLTPETALSAPCEIATAGSPLSKNQNGEYIGTTVTFAKTGMTSNHKGIWTIIPFLCAGQITQRGAWSGGTFLTKTFYPVPFASITQMEVSSYQDSYVITFAGTRTALNLSGKVTFINNQSSTRRLTVSVYFWDSSVSGTPATRSMQNYEKKFDKNVSIPGRGTTEWTVPESFTQFDSRLIQNGVAYIVVSGESSPRGPFSFRRIEE